MSTEAHSPLLSRLWSARLHWMVLVVTVALSVGGCVFDRITLPSGPPTLVVHGVLNPGVSDQVVLVERSLTGAISTIRVPFDSLDPIVSDGGSPVQNARVVVRRTNGDSVVLREDRTWRADGKGAGVYRFQNFDVPAPVGQAIPWFPVIPGERYTLEVRAAEGVVTGSTTVPTTPGNAAPVAPRQFFRDSDSLFLHWGAVKGAARYEIRVESPNGPFIAFVDSLEYLTAGSLTHTGTGRPRVFWPGLRQIISVSAVDRNYFDYYRSGSDELTTRGLITTLAGGHGVFGSVGRVIERLVDVRVQPGDWPAGIWRVVGTAPSPLPGGFELAVESETYGSRRLTGAAMELGMPPRLVVAEQYGNRVQVTILSSMSLRDTLAVLDGTLTSNVGSRFEGTIRGGGSIIYQRLR
ncbi:MAG: DUF4249 family protein [Gemmatimonadaceae bacterium]|nr:DUF4249 family protein [Gemmatimonadaceae bacterium]